MYFWRMHGKNTSKTNAWLLGILRGGVFETATTIQMDYFRRLNEPLYMLAAADNFLEVTSRLPLKLLLAHDTESISIRSHLVIVLKRLLVSDWSALVHIRSWRYILHSLYTRMIAIVALVCYMLLLPVYNK
jgi:hypothetical protein